MFPSQYIGIFYLKDAILDVSLPATSFNIFKSHSEQLDHENIDRAI